MITTACHIRGSHVNSRAAMSCRVGQSEFEKHLLQSSHVHVSIAAAICCWTILSHGCSATCFLFGVHTCRLPLKGCILGMIRRLSRFRPDPCCEYWQISISTLGIGRWSRVPARVIACMRFICTSLALWVDGRHVVVVIATWMR